MTKQTLHTRLVVFSTVVVLSSAIGFADEPRTTGRPGRNDPQSITPLPTEPDKNVGAKDASDDDLLKDTASGMDLTPPQQRLDRQLLSWYGLRTKLANEGYTFDFSLTADYSQNLMGGVNTSGGEFRHLLDMRMSIDTLPTLGYRGGTFSVDFQNQAGESGAGGADDAGDFQGVGNADADGRTQISEIWYEQLLLDNKLRVKIGKIDANSEFAAPDNSGEFINSSYGVSPTVLGIPAYPDAAFGANAFIYPTRNWYLGVGIYDGSAQNGRLTGSYGPAGLWHDDSSLFSIAEVGYRWVCADNTLPGHVGVGVTYHSGDFEKANGDIQSGASSFYVVLDQKIWHKKFYDKGNEQGVYAFGQYGHADKDVSEVSDHVGAGVMWIGPYDKMYPDIVGLGVQTVKFNDDFGFTENYETNIELFYSYQVTPYFSVKPDLQYIMNPGGDETIDDALVATIRVTLAF